MLELIRQLDKENLLHYLECNHKFLGCGSGRKVFDYDSGNVIKVSFNEAGRRQNQIEASIFGNDDICATIYGHGFNYEWVLMEKVKPVTELEFVKYIKTSKDYLFWYLEWMYWRFVVVNDGNAQIAYERYIAAGRVQNKNDVFMERLSNLMIGERLSAGDLSRYNSWGKRKDGNLVLFDYGLNVDVWVSCYNRSESGVVEVIC